jgi:HEAT repeat protein
MSKSFEQALKAIVEKLAPRFREIGERDMQTLLRAGATSFDHARALCVDRRAEVEVRRLACWALGRIGDKEAIPFIVRALAEDSEPSVRAGGAHALGELDDAIAVEPLIRSLTSDESPDVRKMAACALGKIGDVAALATLIEVLTNPDESPDVRAECAEALGEIGQEAAVMPLVNTLGDASEVVRFFAAFALGLLRDPRALPALRHVAATDEGVAQGWGSVREEAAEAIAHIEKVL